MNIVLGSAFLLLTGIFYILVSGEKGNRKQKGARWIQRWGRKHGWQLPEWMTEECIWQTELAVLVAGVLLIAAGVTEQAENGQEISQLRRPAYGQGIQEENLEVEWRDEQGNRKKESMTVDVIEKQLSEKEIETIFSEVRGAIEKEILGENESLKHVDHPLYLREELQEYPVTVRWFSSRPEILDWEGRHGENIREDGEIHWHANVWYMERFHLSEDRLNPSNPVQRLSFIEVTNKKNRELLQEYAKYHVGIGGLTIANIRGQLYEVKRLLEYFKEEESICQVDENQLDDYFRKLEEKDTKDDTFNKRIVHYIKFYQFLNVRGYMKEIPFKPEYYLKKTYPEHHDRTVEEKVYMEILHKLYAFPLVPRLIFLHLWCTGLRISEVCTLKGDAYYWDGEDAWLKVYQIKMKADKMIPIPLVMYRIMRKYIEREHIRPKDYIFKGKDGGAYRGTTFRQEFQQYCDKNGIADGSYIFKTHDYRHTLATQFYDEDVSIQTIRDYLGHFSEEMTKQYVDFMPKRIEKASDTYFKKPENDLASTIKAKKRGERK